ncbi:hypothetical protein CKAH01_17918 [Colletotrichum kahawae]|uniref:Uncharacterized protein n=1 Tax=Colletotrichum kahawae TaxID=34407 RepID=A0AAD9Y9P3_COLKA|nr:hypothetical protein CKAH01_17918 [Colletotrichum kahawae]
MESKPREETHVREINTALLPLSEPLQDHELDAPESARERLICDDNHIHPTAGSPDPVGHESPIAETARQPHVYLIDRIPNQELRRPDENQASWIVHADRIFRGWWLELFCCWLSIASLAALILFLLAINHKPPPSWPSGITVNTVVASLSTVARTAFTVPVAEGLSQCKWNWFKKRPRPIEDFSLFDEASRGPWGSVCLLFRTKGWMIGILSALLLTSSVATSTLTQSAVKYPGRVELEGNATAWKLTSSSDYKFASRLEGTVPQALFSPITNIYPFKEPYCPRSSDCVWPTFQTLAICHEISSKQQYRFVLV